MITVRQLSFLTAIAEHLNFSRAAEACFVTQPTMSAGLKELEDRLGVVLVERTRRRVMLTPAGEQLADRARKVLLDIAEIKVAAQQFKNPFEGDLKLGSIPTIGPYILPMALPVIRAKMPKLRVFLREETTESLIQALEAGQLDVILIALPFETGTLETLPLFDDGYHFASPMDWASQPNIDAITQSDDLMLLEKGHCLHRHALAAYPSRSLSSDDAFAATSLTTLIAMVAEGLGVTLLPNLAVSAGVASTSNVQLVPLMDAQPRQVALAWRAGSARAELFHSLGSILQDIARQPTS